MPSSKFNWWTLLKRLSTWGFVFGLSVIFHWSICLFLCNYHTYFDCTTVSGVLKLGHVSSPTFVLFNIVLAILGLLNSHVNFRISLSISAKKPSGILPGIESIDQFEEYCYLNMKFWSMNLECLSSYFGRLKFLSTILYGFQSLNFAFILLNLFINILFLILLIM